MEGHCFWIRTDLYHQIVANGVHKRGGWRKHSVTIDVPTGIKATKEVRRERAREASSARRQGVEYDPHARLQFTSEAEWYEHVNSTHLEPFAWKYGDGPFAGQPGESTYAVTRSLFPADGGNGAS